MCWFAFKAELAINVNFHKFLYLPGVHQVAVPVIFGFDLILFGENSSKSAPIFEVFATVVAIAWRSLMASAKVCFIEIDQMI